MAIISLGRAFSAVADADPDRPAVTCDGSTTTRGELESLSNRTARALAEMGVGEGNYVTIGLPNSAELYAAVIAAWKLGAVPQPVSPRLPDRERAAIVDLAEPAVVLGAAPDAHPGRTCLPVGWAPDPSLDDGPLADDHVAPAWKAPTSGGSTGRPKLIVAGDPGVIDTDADPGMGVQRDGVMMVPGPMYHNAPFSYSTRGLVSGNHVVTMPRFDAEATLAGIEEHRADWMLLVPTMMLRIWRLDDRERYDVSSLQVVWHMAAPCPPWLKEAWIGWLGGERIFELYAGTEAQAVTVIRGDEWMARRGSVGRALFGEMKVLGPDGAELPPGEVGEIYMRAPGGKVTYRYVGADATRTDDGWESLGDLGSIDADGYVYLTDRLGDMILSGGANIYPAEVEAAIDEHPAVRSCAVIGLPDEELGNKVHAIVQLAPGAVATDDELRAHLTDRLVRYKIPRTFEFSDEPLRDDAGKLRRSALRAERVTDAAS
jgi:bile acid-coenzyme A ligase